MGDGNELGAITLQTTTLHGVTCSIYQDPNGNPEKASRKKTLLGLSIKALQRAGIMFTNADVQAFRVGFYSTGVSRGVVYSTGLGVAPTVVLMLGKRITEHVISQHHTHAAGGLGNPPRIVADRLHDYYKGRTWDYTRATAISAAQMCELAQAFHEFGHIFHQLHDAREFFLNGDVAMNNMIPLGAVARSIEIPALSTCGRTHISQYCGANDGNSLNEFVAEVFSGIMMGVDWNAVDPTGGVMTHYRAMGGPAVPTPRAPLTRMNDFIQQRCSCVRNDGTTGGFGAGKVIW